MKYGLSEDILSLIIKEIKTNLGDTQEPILYLYGSRAKGSHREFSDIDLLLKAQRFDDKSLDVIDFDKLDIPYKIDFVLDKNLFEAYREEIEDHMIEVNL